MDNMDPFKVPEEAKEWGTVLQREERFNPKDFVTNFRKQANRAAESRSAKVAEAFVGAASTILKQFMSFAKQAVEIAISKFLVELCAMIIAGVSAALLSKHKRGVDISTPGVFFNAGGQQPQPASNGSTQQGSLWGNGSSYDGGWTRPGQPAW